MQKRLRVTLKNSTPHPDFFFVTLVLLLTVFGVIMVGNASVVEALRDFGDKFHYFKLQIQWAILGILAFLLALNFHHQRLKIFALPLMVFTLLALGAVLIPRFGIEALGARRWLGIGNYQFQPAELAKFSFILWSAVYLSKRKKILPFLILLLLLVVLLMLEPDLGTTVVLVGSSLVLYFTAGAPIWQMSLLGLIGILGGIGLIFSSPYRKQRLLTFLDPTKDPLGASYHIRQILIAVGSGGIFGVGLGQSRQKYEYLPAVTTDSIFAVIAEETGFLGASLVILIFLVFLWRAFKITKEAPDEFSRLLATGITSWIGLQALINLAAMVALLPLTGIPLPFISYGGSSLVLTLTGVGILANISKYRVVKK